MNYALASNSLNLNPEKLFTIVPRLEIYNLSLFLIIESDGSYKQNLRVLDRGCSFRNLANGVKDGG